MKNVSPKLRIHNAALLMLWLLLAGCADTGGGHVHGSVYMGTGYYDPWYWGPGYVPPPGYIGPPPQRPDRPDRPDHRPPKPTPPIAKPPPRPMPMPRPAARPVMPRR